MKKTTTTKESSLVSFIQIRLIVVVSCWDGVEIFIINLTQTHTQPWQ
jgi:hypothetical protein